MSLADHASPDVRGLWAAVLEKPECDTARLVLADALTDAGDEVRAAYIRAAVRLPPLTAEGHGSLAGRTCPTIAKFYTRRAGGQVTPKCLRCDEAFELECDTARLLRAHEPAWRRAGDCSRCEGGGRVTAPNPAFTRECPACGGTGDRGGLCGRPARGEDDDDGRAFRYRVTWERGFPGIVHAPLSEVFRLVEWPGNGARWVPTPAALAWAREWPLRGVELTDRRPHNRGTGWGWWRPQLSTAIVGREPFALPPQAWGQLRGGRLDGFHWCLFDSETEAVAALGRAVLEVLRAAVREKEGVA